jgi:transcriptional regulator with XRE-family HTH domain
LAKAQNDPLFTVFDKRITVVTQDQAQVQLAKVGAQIRKLRGTRGLNLHELARLCGISAPALSLIENGKRDLRLSSLYRIAAALRVGAGNLLDVPEETPPARETSERRGYDLGDYA